jgi:hypothetical protein
MDVSMENATAINFNMSKGAEIFSLGDDLDVPVRDGSDVEFDREGPVTESVDVAAKFKTIRGANDGMRIVKEPAGEKPV